LNVTRDATILIAPELIRFLGAGRRSGTGPRAGSVKISKKCPYFVVIFECLKARISIPDAYRSGFLGGAATYLQSVGFFAPGGRGGFEFFSPFHSLPFPPEIHRTFLKKKASGGSCFD